MPPTIIRVYEIIGFKMATELERTNLEAHVDLCAIRYEALEGRLGKVETKIEHIHTDILDGQKSMTKVLIGTAGTVVASLVSIVIVILLQ
jgi:hypothetical protein